MCEGGPSQVRERVEVALVGRPTEQQRLLHETSATSMLATPQNAVRAKSSMCPVMWVATAREIIVPIACLRRPNDYKLHCG